MDGPRVPSQAELPDVINFLNSELRSSANWSIAKEYPTAFAKNNLHNLRIVCEQGQILAHSLLKPHIVKTPHIVVKVGAIGSVVTASAHRGQGLSTATINSCLSEALNQNCELAVLWSDKPEFYSRLGFKLAGSEESYVIEKPIPVPAGPQFQVRLGSQIAPDALLRVYQKHSVTTHRTSEEIRLFLQIPNSQVYTAWSSAGQLEAFAIEGKGADLKDYVHEWGGQVPALISIFNFILTTKKKAFTLIAPQHSTNLRLELLKEGLQNHSGYLGLLKIIKPREFIARVNKAQVQLGGAPMNFDHVSESELIEILFGPWTEAVANKIPIEGLKTGLLPLRFWLWGWDSI